MLDRSDLVSILGFLFAFQMACETNRIHILAEMWLFHLFMKKPGRAPLNSRICLTSSSPARQEEKLTPYCKLANYLLATYAADDVIVEPNIDIMNFKKPADQRVSNSPKQSRQKPHAAGPFRASIFSMEHSLKG